MRDILITLLVFGSFPFILMRPSIGLMVWSWLGYMNPHRLAYGFSYSFPFVAITAVVTIVAMIFGKEKLRLPMVSFTIVLLIFIFWLSITTYFSPHAFAVDGLIKSLKIFAMIFATMIVINSKERLLQLTWVIVVSLGFFGVKGGIFAIMTGGSYKVWGPPGSYIAGNNELALALIMVLPLMRFLQLQTTRRLLKHVLTIAMLLTLISILISYSRGAFLAIGVITLFFVLKSNKKILISVSLAIVIPVIYILLPAQWFQRMNTISTYDEDASAMGRFNAWEFAFNLAKDNLFGGGYNTFTPDLFLIYAPNPEDFHDAHSIYFEILGEQGFIGLGLFLLLLAISYRTATYIIRKTKKEDKNHWARDLASMLQISLIGYLTGGAFLGLGYYDLPYQLMAMLAITKIIIDRESSSTSGSR